MAIVNGTSNSEPLNGTSGDDSIAAYGGDDTIFGLAGQDTILAGDGKDRVDAGDGLITESANQNVRHANHLHAFFDITISRTESHATGLRTRASAGLGIDRPQLIDVGFRAPATITRLCVSAWGHTLSIRTSEGHRYCAWGPVAG